MSSTVEFTTQREDIHRLLVAVAVVSVVGLAWAVPTSAFPFATGFQSLLSAVGLLALIGALRIVPGVFRHTRLSVPEWTLIGFIGVGSLQTLIAPATLGRLAVLFWWIQALFLMLVLARIVDRKLLLQCLHGCCWLAVSACVVFIIYRWTGESGRAPFIIHQNHFALLLILPSAFLLHRVMDRSASSRPAIAAIGVTVLLTALLLTQSRAVWLGIAVSAGFIMMVLLRRSLLSRSRKDLLTVLSVLVVIVLAVLAGDAISVRLGNASLFSVFNTFNYLGEGSIGGRFRRWSNALALIQDHWLTGVGLGNWNLAYENYRHSMMPDSAGNPSALNTYLLILAETGVVGFGLFLAFIVAAIRRGLSGRIPVSVPAAAVGWLVAICFHSMYDFKIVLLGFALVFGILLWPAHSNRRPLSLRAGKLWLNAGLLLTTVMFLFDARYSLADLEREALYGVIWGSKSADRKLWRLIDPLSQVVDVPLTRDAIVANVEGLTSANDFQFPDNQDFNLIVGSEHYVNQNYEEARIWFQRAVDRNPTSVSALLSVCYTELSAGNLDAARDCSKRGISLSPANPQFHWLLAQVEAKSGEGATATGHLVTARKLLRDRMDLNDFGYQSRNVVSGYYQSFQSISDDLERLRSDVTTANQQILMEIVEMPSIHKSMAIAGCHLYISTNINARYNLWRLDLCGSEDGLQLRTNDSLSPFRLRAAGNHVYFMADQRGDNLFNLYAFDVVADRSSMIDRPPGRLLEYSPSPDNKRLAVVVYDRGAFRLFVGNPQTGQYDQVFQSNSPLGEAVWLPENPEADLPAGGFLFAEGSNRIHQLNLATRQTMPLIQAETQNLGKFAVAPDGRSMVYVVRQGRRHSELHVRGPDGATRLLLETQTSVVTDPMWRDPQTVVFREVVRDEYLLRQISTDGTGYSPIGPPAGVVYGVVEDPSSDALVFAAATDRVPASVYRIAGDAVSAELLLRFDWMAPEMTVPHERIVMDHERDVVLYRYAAVTDNRAAVVWLHGGSNRFSPRWHSYAQFFARSGYEFLALNYHEPWPRGGQNSFAEQAAETEELVRSLRNEGFEHVFLVGVSTGTQIIQEYLARGIEPVDAAIEYSPINNQHWDTPKLLPSLLVFTGENDRLLNHSKRIADIDRHREFGSDIEWIVYENEGHDLRGRAAIEHRMWRTVEYLNTIRRLKTEAVQDEPSLVTNPIATGDLFQQ